MKIRILLIFCISSRIAKIYQKLRIKWVIHPSERVKKGEDEAKKSDTRVMKSEIERVKDDDRVKMKGYRVKKGDGR